MGLAAIIVRVHSALEQLGSDCSMEELVDLCPELTWNQAFIAIDYLSRSGQVRVTVDGDRTYRVQAQHAVPVAAPSSSPAPL
ncbi:MAG: hypothetical protein Nkreftii_000223 [Candidatus Nitrospira kreftii]|uniref:Uncharacterized protein n=1 Tax=Candidatus Nitrospira kreftii TaxID=2652173 RepID=A0A7S8FAA6_9BACT|nr:MAG: hypothetical protein Nkreftii_000223 [Candidatus Nitrospira kreftii]